MEQDLDNFTYGLEIEFVDTDRETITLPRGCSWNKKEVTLVNSDGVAVDSTGRTKNTRGGEINTCPTDTLDEQVNVAEKCLKVLKNGNAKVNYRCNLHVHVGLSPKHQNVESLKKIQKYAYDNFTDLIMLTMGEGQFNKKPEYPLSFWSHYKERMVPKYKHDYLLQSDSLKDFQMTFFKAKDGRHAPMTFMRQLVNTHSFFKTKTIEYRGFWGTLDINEIRSCLEFTDFIVFMALCPNPRPISEYKKLFEGKFPKELPFSSKLEEGFQKTKVEKP